MWENDLKIVPTVRINRFDYPTLSTYSSSSCNISQNQLSHIVLPSDQYINTNHIKLASTSYFIYIH